MPSYYYKILSKLGTKRVFLFKTHIYTYTIIHCKVYYFLLFYVGTYSELYNHKTFTWSYYFILSNLMCLHIRFSMLSQNVLKVLQDIFY